MLCESTLETVKPCLKCRLHNQSKTPIERLLGSESNPPGRGCSRALSLTHRGRPWAGLEAPTSAKGSTHLQGRLLGTRNITKQPSAPLDLGQGETEATARPWPAPWPGASRI